MLVGSLKRQVCHAFLGREQFQHYFQNYSKIRDGWETRVDNVRLTGIWDINEIFSLL
jgi:hypothetical protein